MPNAQKLLQYLSVGSQASILILATVLIFVLTTKQHKDDQVEALRIDTLSQLEKDKKELTEKIAFLKEELVSYQSTREAENRLLSSQLEDEKEQRKSATERLNRRIDNLNSKLYYWTGKVKDQDVQGKIDILAGQ